MNRRDTDTFEAADWLRRHPKRKRQSPLASIDRFASMGEALAFVNRLYAAGAVDVLIDRASLNPQWEPSVGQYATSESSTAKGLLLRVPNAEDGSRRVLDILRQESGLRVEEHAQCPGLAAKADTRLIRLTWTMGAGVGP